MFRAKATACLIGGYSTCFSEFEYRTAKSWSRARRVIGKAQVTPKGENPRFIVTNLPADKDRWMPEVFYRKFYCARGDMENRIKEQQLELFSDRMSCKQMESNQLRLWFSTFAYNLMIALRERGSIGCTSRPRPLPVRPTASGSSGTTAPDPRRSAAPAGRATSRAPRRARTAARARGHSSGSTSRRA